MGRKKAPPPAFATRKGSWDRNHYIMLFDDQLDSLAYIALSAHAKEAYTILRQEYKGPYTENSVICPYSTFKKKSIRGNTLSRALLMLEVFGFIEIDHGGLMHQPNIFHFSTDWQNVRTKEDVEERKALFQEELDKRKRAKGHLPEDTTPYGKYIRSNESVSYEDEKNREISNGNDSKVPYQDPSQLTKPIASQVAEPIVGNDQKPPQPKEKRYDWTDTQLLKALVEGDFGDPSEKATEPLAEGLSH